MIEMNKNKHIELNNGSVPVKVAELPVLDYNLFHDEVVSLLKSEKNHCLNYFCFPFNSGLKFICCIADDDSGTVRILSHKLKNTDTPLRSITSTIYALHIFERSIHEIHGVKFEGHPWLKPVRYPYERADKHSIIKNYPFYEMESEELHEVGVGPIHAGIIEPGHFRFICNGEKVLHLEIQLGYQHRGIEQMFSGTFGGLQRSILAENIAGDTAVGHGLAYSQLVESLAGFEPSDDLQAERCIALEMERIAIHIGDTAALCADIAYQLGQVACEALRTLVINTTQYWCGNRFGKGLIRPGGTNYRLTDFIAERILNVLAEVEKRFANVTDCLYARSGILERFEETGTITRKQAALIGTVGMAARTCGITRDIRKTHPFQYFRKMDTVPVVLETGDVLARSMLRSLEVKESIKMIQQLIAIWRTLEKKAGRPVYDFKFKPDSLGISITEGWRGEICHVAITGNNGQLEHYSIKEPSMHNWLALALAVRNQEISDFPVCNKSFNLSYCGNDL